MRVWGLVNMRLGKEGWSKKYYIIIGKEGWSKKYYMIIGKEGWVKKYAWGLWEGLYWIGKRICMILVRVGCELENMYDT